MIRRTVLVLTSLALAACSMTHSTTDQSATNPFFAPSTLPYQAPPFDKIHNGDYQSALEEGMKRELAEIDTIANQTAAPTFENTVVAMEKTGELLTRVENAFGAVTAANTNDTLQKIETEEAPKLAAHHDTIYQNAKLYARVTAVYSQRDKLGLTPEQHFLVERTHLGFVRAGADLPDSAQAKLRLLNQQEAKLSTDFQNTLLAATKAGAPVVTDKSLLDGLSDAQVAAAPTPPSSVGSRASGFSRFRTPRNNRCRCR